MCFKITLFPLRIQSVRIKCMLQSWEAELLMEFNQSKCEAITFTKKISLVLSRVSVPLSLHLHTRSVTKIRDDILSTRKLNQLSPNIHSILHRVILATVITAKYLGLNINNKLSWNNHTDAINKRASQSLNFVGRNFSSCPASIREPCYMSLVRPQLEYASSVWDNPSKLNITKIESVREVQPDLCAAPTSTHQV